MTALDATAVPDDTSPLPKLGRGADGGPQSAAQGSEAARYGTDAPDVLMTLASQWADEALSGIAGGKLPAPPIPARTERPRLPERPQRPPAPEFPLAPEFPQAPESTLDPERQADAAAAPRRGRHAAAPRPLDRRGERFLVFASIGGVIFVVGLAIQALLTGGWHVSPIVSYLVQAFVSVEASFLLNRWLTWRDRDTPFWHACGRFNLQKTVTVTLNLALYAGLIRLGMNYLLANIVLTAVFTVVNYVAGDRLVFTPARKQQGPAGGQAQAGSQLAALQLAAPQLAGPRPGTAEPAVTRPPLQSVSVVIPCRNNERTIRAAVESLLGQDYPGLHEIILIGSPHDTTWSALTDITDPRLIRREKETPPGVRDANFKRDFGIKMTTGDLIALVDSDVVLPAYWMTQAVTALENSSASCVAGGMKSIHDSFWGRYTDGTVIGAKTPRIAASYTVNSENFGMSGRKPPITANTIFTRELYESCPIDPYWSHGSYEDYEWFWRVASSGHEILVCTDLFGWHHHRRGLRALTSEYRRSSRGCAYFIRAHRGSPLAQRRLRQAFVLPLAALAGAGGTAAAIVAGYGLWLTVAALAGVVVLAGQQFARSRRLESLAYPAVGLALGVAFTSGLVTHLIRSAGYQHVPGDGIAAAGGRRPARPPLSHRVLPLTAICVIQAALSATLIWSNTAFADEAHYLWAGRLVLAGWLHGTPVPNFSNFSGSPDLYPPLGALADAAGGLAGARLLSLALMLVATVLLYLTAARLSGRLGGVFAAALFAISEPALRLAFATYDPMSVMLTALAAWLAVQAGYRRRRGELVALSAAALALANATAYSGIVIDPVLIAFAFLAWLPRMGRRQALYCAAWLTAGLALVFAGAMSLTRSWAGTADIFARSSPDHQSALLIVTDVWNYSGLVLVAAVIGAIVAASAEGRWRGALLAVLGATIFVVPAAQLHEHTGWSLDKHLAYGIWFAAIAAGYGGSKLVHWPRGARRRLLGLCCAVALVYPMVNSWESAWEVYHSWPDSRAFITAFRPAVAGTQGLIDVSGQQNVAEYYTPQGNDWQRWNNIPLSPGGISGNTALSAYYRSALDSGKYGVVALFYSTTFSSAQDLPGSILLSPRGGRTYSELLGLVGANSGEPDLPLLTRALERDPGYRLAATGPYDTSNISGKHTYGVFAIWRQVRP